LSHDFSSISVISFGLYIILLISVEKVAERFYQQNGVTNAHIQCRPDTNEDTPSGLGKKSCLRQRHGLQNTTLTSLFYKNNYWKVIYVYFYDNFQNKSIDMIFTFLNSTI
jgi:hypothetical protein